MNWNRWRQYIFPREESLDPGFREEVRRLSVTGLRIIAAVNFTFTLLFTLLVRIGFPEFKDPQATAVGYLTLVAAGTADLPVAEEARVTCRFLGHEPEAVYDVGVAGLHRLLARTDALQRARVVIAVAGMEGALASVVGGLVGAPVVGLPTSVGYGTGSGGLAALLSMLNSCAANVCCVNIDDGFGAAVVACLINRAGD